MAKSSTKDKYSRPDSAQELTKTLASSLAKIIIKSVPKKTSTALNLEAIKAELNDSLWSNLHSHTSSLREIVNQLRYYSDGFLLRDIENSIAHLDAQLDNVRAYSTQLQARLRPLSDPSLLTQSLVDEKTIVEDLIALKKEFYDVYCQREGKDLVVVTNEVIFYSDTVKINLGRFRIIINLNKLNIGMISTEPVTPNERNGNPHPHVTTKSEDYHLCYGDLGGVMVANALKAGDIFQACVLINTILKTYNSESPYQELEQWLDDEGTQCEECKEYFADGDIVCCRGCESNLCKNDRFQCGWPGCDNFMCDDCTNKCTVTHTARNVKARYMCQDHGELCESCHNIVCSLHATKCKECENVFCNSEGCKFIKCRGCKIERCDGCLKPIKCQNCAKEACRECITKVGCKGCSGRAVRNTPTCSRRNPGNRSTAGTKTGS